MAFHEHWWFYVAAGGAIAPTVAGFAPPVWQDATENCHYG